MNVKLRLLEMENEVNEIIAMFDVEVSELLNLNDETTTFAITAYDKDKI